MLRCFWIKLKEKYLKDADTELAALGATNLAAGALQGFPVSCSGSRTTIADAMHAKTQLYSLAVVLRDPTIQMVTTELWYPDVNDLARAQYTRLQALRLQAGFDRRFKKMTNATEFPATPNIESCRYCPYHPVRGSGHCEKGV